LILVAIFVVVIGGDLILPVVEEGFVLLLETLELVVDTLFEELLHLAPEVAQLATAWTGLIALIVLLIWGGFKLNALYHRAKTAVPLWWDAKMDEIDTWWRTLPWTQKAAVLVSTLGSLVLLILLM
jgi:hypothetical protein